MARNPFSTYGQLAQLNPPGCGKLFILVPASSAHIPALQDQFPVDEDGVSRVYTTLATAVAAVVSGRGDVIACLPGTHTISTVVSSSASDFKLLAIGRPGQTVLTGSGASILTLTGNGVEVAGFTWNLATTKKCITLTGASGCDIHDNVFLSAVGGSASHFIHMLTTACNYNWIHDNRFISNLVVAGGAITQTSHITGLGIGNLIEHNFFVAGRVTTANAGAVTDGIVFIDAADTGNLIRYNSFTEFNGATFTAGVETGASTVSGAAFIVRNDFLLATAANAVVNTAGAAGFGNNVANGTV